MLLSHSANPASVFWGSRVLSRVEKALPNTVSPSQSGHARVRLPPLWEGGRGGLPPLGDPPVGMEVWGRPSGGHGTCPLDWPIPSWRTVQRVRPRGLEGGGWSQAASLLLSHGAPWELCEQFKNNQPGQPAHPAWALAHRVFSSSLKKHFLSLSVCQGKKLRAKGRQSGLGREPASRIIIFQ